MNEFKTHQSTAFTFTMPDTPENPAEYPQQKGQKPGLGLPIARIVGIISLATACAMDVAIGPYSGKETGESTLVRSMLDRLSPNDVAVMDRLYMFAHVVGVGGIDGMHGEYVP